MTPRGQLLVAWVVLVALLLYLPNPVNIQRRLTDGVYLPIALLAAMTLARMWAAGRRRGALLLTSASCISALVALGIGINWALSREPVIYIQSSEARAMDWMAAQRPPCYVPAILSDPDTGLFIPARAGFRVYVGHYSETLDFLSHAEAARTALRSGSGELRAFMVREDVEFVFWGPRERALGGPPPDSGIFTRAYDVDGVVIFGSKGAQVLSPAAMCPLQLPYAP
jgi:hypothetical protein